MCHSWIWIRCRWSEPTWENVFNSSNKKLEQMATQIWNTGFKKREKMKMSSIGVQLERWWPERSERMVEVDGMGNYFSFIRLIIEMWLPIFSNSPIPILISLSTRNRGPTVLVAKKESNKTHGILIRVFMMLEKQANRANGYTNWF